MTTDTFKTKIVKYLAYNLGSDVIVNNCSDKMDIQNNCSYFLRFIQNWLLEIFNEFNNIYIEVLSAVSTRVKSVLDEMRAGISYKIGRFIIR